MLQSTLQMGQKPLQEDEASLQQQEQQQQLVLQQQQADDCGGEQMVSFQVPYLPKDAPHAETPDEFEYELYPHQQRALHRHEIGMLDVQRCQLVLVCCTDGRVVEDRHQQCRFAQRRLRRAGFHQR